MQPTEISVARWKIGLYLAGSLALAGMALVAVLHPDGEAWKAQLGLLFFGLCVAVFSLLMVRPQRLLMDRQGFTVVGGLVLTPKTIAWGDIEPFFVYRMPRGGKMIGYNYRPGVRQETIMTRLGRALAADGSLPKGWPKSQEKMVEELNAYREQALGATGGAMASPMANTFGAAPARTTFGMAQPRRTPTVT